jgi:hypothetical protein
MWVGSQQPTWIMPDIQAVTKALISAKTCH